MKFTLKEMNGLLNGKCLPSDLIVGETLAEYLVRKFSALEQRLIESERYGRQTDITIDNLEMKLEKMAAELSAVEAIHNVAVFITDDHYEQCPPEVQKMIRALAVLKVPSYHAFLSEIRASGVEMAVDVVKQCYDNICAGGLQENREYEESIVQPHLDGIDDELNEIIAQLRKGVQS